MNIPYILECIQNIKWPTVSLLFKFLLLYNESVGRRLSFSLVLMNLRSTVLKLNHGGSSISVSQSCSGPAPASLEETGYFALDIISV